MKDFNAYLASEGRKHPDLIKLKADVEALAASFPMPGVEEDTK